MSKIDEHVWRVLSFLCGVLMLVMVGFTLYTIVMRYVFLDPPFWGDTLTMFANIALVMFAFAIATRRNEHIAMQGLYSFISPVIASALEIVWRTLLLAFALLLIVFGFQAAMDIPGQFWELGGLPKRVPMMIMPLSGVMIAIASAIVLKEEIDTFRKRLAERRARR